MTIRIAVVHIRKIHVNNKLVCDDAQVRSAYKASKRHVCDDQYFTLGWHNQSSIRAK
jgi:hypothetical protein